MNASIGKLHLIIFPEQQDRNRQLHSIFNTVSHFRKNTPTHTTEQLIKAVSDFEEYERSDPKKMMEKINDVGAGLLAETPYGYLSPIVRFGLPLLMDATDNYRTPGKISSDISSELLSGPGFYRAVMVLAASDRRVSELVNDISQRRFGIRMDMAEDDLLRRLPALGAQAELRDLVRRAAEGKLTRAEIDQQITQMLKRAVGSLNDAKSKLAAQNKRVSNVGDWINEQSRPSEIEQIKQAANEARARVAIVTTLMDVIGAGRDARGDSSRPA